MRSLPQYRYCVKVFFVSSVGLSFRLRFRVSLGLVKVSLGLVRFTVTLGLA